MKTCREFTKCMDVGTSTRRLWTENGTNTTFKAKLAEQVKKFAHPTTGSQQQPQVRCSLKLGRKKRLSVTVLQCFEEILARRFIQPYTSKPRYDTRYDSSLNRLLS